MGQTTTITRGQRRAQHAYRCAAVAAERGHLAEYKIAVNGLGPNTMSSGLAGAMAFLERTKGKAADQLLDDLGQFGLTPIAKCAGREIPAKVRELDVSGYLLATREMLKLCLWLKRAVQALKPDDD